MPVLKNAKSELDFLLKKQGLKPKFKPFAIGGWGGWIRTNE